MLFWILRIFSKCGIARREAADTAFMSPISQRLSLLQIFCLKLGKILVLNILSQNFQHSWATFGRDRTNVTISVASLLDSTYSPTY
jgi:hypothetical protein